MEINYSHYSLGGSLLSIHDIVSTPQSQSEKVAILADESTLAGVPEFKERCKEKGIKPIIGSTLNISFKGKPSGNVVFLAKNKQGYQELQKLVSSQDVDEDGFRQLDIESISKSSNLIAVVGGRNSIIEKSSVDDAKLILEKLSGFYGDNTFLTFQYADELKDSRDPMKRLSELDLSLNESVRSLSKDLKIKKIISNQVRYNGQSLENLVNSKRSSQNLSIQSNAGLSNFVNLLSEKYGGSSQYGALMHPFTKSQFDKFIFGSNKYEKMNRDKMLAGIEEYSIGSVAEAPSNSNDLREYLKPLFADFLKTISPADRPKYEERLEKELDVIYHKKFENYFMVISEITDIARKSDIIVSPRGSALSSLALYLLGVSDIDPVPHDLYFERFLSKERSGYPDIDLEFSDSDKLKSLLVNHYGDDNIATIIIPNTFQKSMATIEMVAKLHEPKFNEALEYLRAPQQLKNGKTWYLFPNKDFNILDRIKDKVSVKRAILEAPADIRQEVNDLMLMSINAQGKINNYSRSSATMVISDQPVLNKISVRKDIGSEPIASNIAEADKSYIEKMGFIKFDLLSSKYMNNYQGAIKRISEAYGRSPETFARPTFQSDVFEMFDDSFSGNVFQMPKGGPGHKAIRKIQPRNLSELRVAIALSRPGAADNIDKYLSNKNSQSSIDYIDPKIEPYLSDTYGVIIFEEQVMRLAADFGGLDGAETTKLRKAMSSDKDDADALKIIESFRDKFITNSIKNGLNNDQATTLFSKMKDSMGYSFNQAHATQYAINVYREVWMRKYFPGEYIENFCQDDDKKADYKKECELRGVSFTSPDINKSESHYKTKLVKENGNLNISVISSLPSSEMSNNFIETLIAERSKESFKSPLEFVERMMSKVYGDSLYSSSWASGYNKYDFKSNTLMLINGGYLDSLLPESILKQKGADYGREMLKESLDDMMDFAVSPYKGNTFKYTPPSVPDAKQDLSLDSRPVQKKVYRN